MLLHKDLVFSGVDLVLPPMNVQLSQTFLECSQAFWNTVSFLESYSILEWHIPFWKTLMVSQLVYCEIIFVFSHASSNVTHDCIL